MSGKLAVKKLTASDLTVFEWHFRNLNAGNQKSINLNRNVFIDQLFPALPEISEVMGGRVPLDLHIFGPGLQDDYNLQRKIIKHGTYKNWRLNGEYIFNPEDTPERFNSLVSGDYVLLEFSGELHPTSARAFFVASSLKEDTGLHSQIENFIEGKSMVSLGHDDLKKIIDAAEPSEEHPVYELLLEASLEDAAYNGLEGTRKLNHRRSGTRMSMETLLKARNNAERIGREGEEIINALFESQKAAEIIEDFEWTSDDNAVAPYDFELINTDEFSRHLDVKSTRGSFSRKLHISIAELHEMAHSEQQYDIYRVYDLHAGTAKLRIAHDLAPFANKVLTAFKTLPAGVTPDSISLEPETLNFETEQIINLPDEEE